MINNEVYVQAGAKSASKTTTDDRIRFVDTKSINIIGTRCVILMELQDVLDLKGVEARLVSPDLQRTCIFNVESIERTI